MNTDILLVAINSRYSHTNLAIRSITEYVKQESLCDSELLKEKIELSISYGEWTISHPILEILRGISAYQPKLILFSVYIWNSQISYQVISELKKICPNAIIGAGGPEVSYNPNLVKEKCPAIDFVMSGEGENVVLDIVKSYYLGNLQKTINSKYVFFPKSLIQDLSVLPFPYPELINDVENADTQNRIYYYESSRGCPFSCSYCLSSIDKSVRFMSLERTFADLDIFMRARVKLVKFVDRTFNLNEKRYIAIWEHIRDTYNGHTRFHFEIAAEFLSDEALDMLSSMPEGSIQFEIGIQSIHPETLKTVGRTSNIEKLATKIRKIPKSIHVHLDLIAGLPHENLSDFAKSFDYTYRLNPDMLQLGFLKVLSGTEMEKYASSANYKMMSIPPYEVLETPDMAWADLLFLKDVEKLLDIYSNSGNFSHVMKYITDINEISPFDFYAEMVHWYNEKDILALPHKEVFWFDSLLEFVSEFSKHKFIDKEIILELLKFQYVKRIKVASFPAWYKSNYDKNSHHQALLKYGDMRSTRLAYANSSYEEFEINPLTLEKTKTSILFLYQFGKPTEVILLTEE